MQFSYIVLEQCTASWRGGANRQGGGRGTLEVGPLQRVVRLYRLQ
jgi:hypothetical protein